jgi:hypothetical protein
MRIVAWVLLIAIGAQFFQAAPWLVFLFGAVLAAGIYLSKVKKAKLEAKTLGEMGTEPLGNILDSNRAMTASSSRMLVGNGSFDFEVVGESFYKPNFLALQRNLGLEDGQDFDDEACLIADPGNLHLASAVAVFVSGLKLGYLPEDRSASVYSFLLQNGGFAKADAAIYFSSGDGQNSIWLDVSLPLSFRN